MKKSLCMFLLLCTLILIVGGCSKNEATESEESKYNRAFDLIEAGDHAAAYDLLNELGNYKDAAEQLSLFRYVFKSVEYVDTNGTVLASTTAQYNKQYLPTQLISNYGEGEFVDEEYSYDENNNLIERTFSGMSVPFSIEYSYDSNGQLIKSTDTIYTYDDSGKLIKETTPHLLNREVNYTYDTAGNLIKEVWSGISNIVIEYAYDNNNNRIKDIRTDYDYEFDDNGDPLPVISTIEYSYDAEGKLIKSVQTDPYFEIYYETTYEYDANGNIIKYIQTDSEGTQSIAILKYERAYIPFVLSEQIEKIITFSPYQ